MADAFGFCLHCRLQHVGVDAFCKYYTLRVASGCLSQLAGEFALLSHQLFQMLTVFVPIGNGLLGYTAFHGSPCHSHGHFSNESWVYGFGYEVVRTEGEIVHLISFIYHVRYRKLGQIGNGVYGGQLHLFVDGCGCHIQGSTENIGETYDVIYLVGIVAATGRHQYIRTGAHGIFIRDLRDGIGQGKHDWVVCHAANHVLCQHVAFGQS